MTGERLNVDKSEIGGDVAGRDIDKSMHFHYAGSKGSYMKLLLEKFKEEQKNNLQLTTFIDDLDYYYNKKKDDIIGLQEKLTDANRQDLIDFAEDFKDRFHRKLFQYQHSEAAQNIMLHLLADVQSRFVNEIYPMICIKEEIEIVNTMITIKIIEPVREQLYENLLGITAQHINGMLYFLTGNCHIKWTK
jgi:hypothetical protein